MEILYNEYKLEPAFAVASLLMFLAILTLIAKNLIEWHTRREAEQLAAAERAES